MAGIPVPEPFIESFGLGVAGIGFGIAAIGEGISFIGAATQGAGKAGIPGAVSSIQGRYSALSPLLNVFGPAGKFVGSVIDSSETAENVLEPSFSEPQKCN